MEARTVERHANIQLPYVKRSGGMPIRDAMSRRRSHRMFNSIPLAAQTLADLLWCGFGVNRPDEGGRTAPSARGWREIDIYVALADAAYCYDPVLNRLNFVAEGDIRSATGVQDFVPAAPLNLVYVADYSKMEGVSEAQRDVFAAADAAFVAQNIYLFCAAEGLSTVVRALIEHASLAKALKLNHNQRIVLAQSVGYPRGG